MAKKFATRAAQRAARKRAEEATAEIVDRHLSMAFDRAIEAAARENPRSHSGHFVRMFARTIWDRTGGLYGHYDGKERKERRR
jgi:hypothetical protein